MDLCKIYWRVFTKIYLPNSVSQTIGLLLEYLHKFMIISYRIPVGLQSTRKKLEQTKEMRVSFIYIFQNIVPFMRKLQ